jgi:hypothetical protein
MKFKSLPIIERALEEGINYGYMRAHKHTATPSEDTLKHEMFQSVLNALHEIITFEGDDFV